MTSLIGSLLCHLTNFIYFVNYLYLIYLFTHFPFRNLSLLVPSNSSSSSNSYLTLLVLLLINYSSYFISVPERSKISKISTTITKTINKIHITLSDFLRVSPYSLSKSNRFRGDRRRTLLQICLHVHRYSCAYTLTVSSKHPLHHQYGTDFL